MSVIESMNLKTEIYLEIHNIILCKLYKLVILEIAKDKSKQNFKENVINPFIKWLFNKNDISEFIKIKDIKELKQLLITNIIKLLFEYWVRVSFGYIIDKIALICKCSKSSPQLSQICTCPNSVSSIHLATIT